MPVMARRGCCTSFQWPYVFLLWSAPGLACTAGAYRGTCVRKGRAGERAAGLSNEGGEFNGPSAGAARPTNPAAVACSVCLPPHLMESETKNSD